jgi:hypothetical protein
VKRQKGETLERRRERDRGEETDVKRHRGRDVRVTEVKRQKGIDREEATQRSGGGEET